MRVITLNANGIRSAERKGFFRWLARQRADVVCLQELKAHLHQIDVPAFYQKSFHCYYHPAERPGYSRRGFVLAGEAGPDHRGFRLGRVRSGGPLPGGSLRPPVGGFPVCTIWVFERGTPAGKIPVHGRVHGAPPVSAAPARHRVRRLEYCALRNRLEKLALEPEEFGFPAGRTGLDGPGVRFGRIRGRLSGG